MLKKIFGSIFENKDEKRNDNNIVNENKLKNFIFNFPRKKIESILNLNNKEYYEKITVINNDIKIKLIFKNGHVISNDIYMLIREHNLKKDKEIVISKYKDYEVSNEIEYNESLFENQQNVVNIFEYINLLYNDIEIEYNEKVNNISNIINSSTKQISETQKQTDEKKIHYKNKENLDYGFIEEEKKQKNEKEIKELNNEIKLLKNEIQNAKQEIKSYKTKIVTQETDILYLNTKIIEIKNDFEEKNEILKEYQEKERKNNEKKLRDKVKTLNANEENNLNLF